jgi:hypothetical protein
MRSIDHGIDRILLRVQPDLIDTICEDHDSSFLAEAAPDTIGLIGVASPDVDQNTE